MDTNNIHFTDKLSGHQFIMNNSNDTAQHMINDGIYEWPLIQWCEQFSNTDKIFVDIGAHIGTYAIHLSSHFNEVHAFEAMPLTYYNLCGSIALNNKNNIRPHNIALGNLQNNGQTKKLYQFTSDGGGTTLDDNVLNHMGQPTVIHQVQVRSLDSYGLTNVGFMKIDVEGWEIEVLKGSVNTLFSSGWPQFIFEAWSDAWYETKKKELFTFIESMGYKIVPIGGTNNMFIAEHK